MKLNMTEIYDDQYRSGWPDIFPGSVPALSAEVPISLPAGRLTLLICRQHISVTFHRKLFDKVFNLCFNNLNKSRPCGALIQRGRGTGPMKPQQPII